MGNSKGDALFSQKVKPQEFEGANLDALVDQVLSLIESDDDDEEPQSYCLRAEYDDGDTVRVSKPITNKGSGGNIERQLLVQAHRHIEVLTRGVAHMLDSNARVQTQRAEIELEGLQKYGELRNRMLIAEQENADRSHERLLEAKREDRKAEWIDQGVKAILNIAPMFAGKLGGIMPQSATAVRATPQYQTLRSLFENQPAENWANIAAWLQNVPLNSVAEKAAFQMVIDSVMADMIEAEKEKEKDNGKADVDASIRH